MPTLAELATVIAPRLDGEVGIRGDAGTEIAGLGAIETAAPGQITHLSGRAYQRFLPTTRASAVLLREADAPACPAAAVVVANPYLAFALVSQLFDDAPVPPAGIEPGASVHPHATVDATASIGANATLAAGAAVGPRARIGPGAHVGENSVVGADSVVHAGAALYHGVRIGERCVIHSHAVIGADGFGFTPDERGRLVAIAQLGGVVLGNDVVIGAGTMIDRGAIDDTIVGDGVKMDNNVQIGHTLICGCAGMVGSTRIGRHCVLAGAARIGGDQPIEICDFVQISVDTTVTRSITEPGIYSGGVLHSPHRQWKRNALRFNQLGDLARRVARLEASAARAR